MKNLPRIILSFLAIAIIAGLGVRTSKVELKNIALEYKVQELKKDSVEAAWKHSDTVEEMGKKIHELQVLYDFSASVRITLTNKANYWKKRALKCHKNN